MAGSAARRRRPPPATPAARVRGGATSGTDGDSSDFDSGLAERPRGSLDAFDDEADTDVPPSRGPRGPSEQAEWFPSPSPGKGVRGADPGIGDFKVNGRGFGGGGSGGEAPPQLLVHSRGKWENLRVRTLWTLAMLAGFFGVLYAGHMYAALLVLFCQFVMARELFHLARNMREQQKLPWFRRLNYYFYSVTGVFTYGRLMARHLSRASFQNPLTHWVLGSLVMYHNFIFLMLYIVGIVVFILNLRKKYLKYMFSQFAWTHMIIILIQTQGAFLVANVFEGMIWFVIPCGMVVCNDIFAYLFGFAFGRTPLLAISPKKTVEGFIGGAVSTMVLGFFLADLFSMDPWMTCPQQDFTFRLHYMRSCEPSSIFVKQYVRDLLPDYLASLRPLVGSAMVKPFQLHALMLCIFASSLAPFGGFFASGFKRAVKIKDFGHSIPGHGGLTDRMDCQVVMGLISYVYYNTFVAGAAQTVDGALNYLSHLQDNEQLEVFNFLKQSLREQGVL